MVLLTPPLLIWFWHIRNLVAKLFYLQSRFSSMTCCLLSSLCTNIEHTTGIWKGRCSFLRSIHVNIGSKKDMGHLIRLNKASAVLHNLFVGTHPVPKSWLSVEDLISPDFDDELKSDEFLNPDLTGHPEGTHHEEVYSFLSTI